MTGPSLMAVDCAGRIRRAQPSCDTRLFKVPLDRVPLLADERVLLAGEPEGALGLVGFGASRARAQTAVARTSAASSSRQRRAAPRRRGAGSIADRDQHVAHEAVAADALDRRAGEERAERRIVERREVGQTRRASIPARGSKSRLTRRLRELVPRADRQTIVAAVDAVAHQRAQFARDQALVLDRQVGDAAPRIEPIGRRKRPGRADIETAPARAAMVGSGASGGSQGSDRSRRGTATSRSWRETRLVCLPCQPMPARCGQRLFHHRRGVDEDLERARPSPGDRIARALQPRFDEIVIVAPARIDGDRAAVARSSSAGQRIVLGRIVDARARRRCAPRARALAACAAPLGARRPANPCRRDSRGDNSREIRRAPRPQARPRKADRVEAQRQRLVADRRLDRASRHRSSASAIGRDALVGQPQPVGRRAGLVEHVDRDAAARIPIAADPQPVRRDRSDQAARDAKRAVLVKGADDCGTRRDRASATCSRRAPLGHVVDDEMREIGLAGDRAQRGEFGAGEAHQIERAWMRVRRHVSSTASSGDAGSRVGRPSCVRAGSPLISSVSERLMSPAAAAKARGEIGERARGDRRAHPAIRS